MTEQSKNSDSKSPVQYDYQEYGGQGSNDAITSTPIPPPLTATQAQQPSNGQSLVSDDTQLGVDKCSISMKYTASTPTYKENTWLPNTKYKYPCSNYIIGNCQSSPCKLSHDPIFAKLNKTPRAMVICKDYIFKKRLKCDRVCHYIHCSEDEAEYYWKNAKFEDSHFEKVLSQNYILISQIIDHTCHMLEFDNTEIMVNGKLSLCVENKKAIEALIFICHAHWKYAGYSKPLTDAISKSAKGAANSSQLMRESPGSKMSHTQLIGDNNRMIQQRHMIAEKVINTSTVKKSFDPNINSNYMDANKKQQFVNQRDNNDLFYRPFMSTNSNGYMRRKYSPCNTNSVEDLPGSSLAMKRHHDESLINKRDKVSRVDNNFEFSSFDLETDGSSKLSSLSNNNKPRLQNEHETLLNVTNEQKALIVSKQIEMITNHYLKLNEADAFKLVVQDQLGNEVRKLLFKIVNQYHSHNVKEIAIESIKECCTKAKYTE